MPTAQPFPTPALDLWRKRFPSGMAREDYADAQAVRLWRVACQEAAALDAMAAGQPALAQRCLDEAARILKPGRHHLKLVGAA